MNANNSRPPACKDWLRTRTQQLLEWWPVDRARRTISQFAQDDASMMAASVAYFAALAFFPLLLLSIAATGAFLQFTTTGQDAQLKVLSAIQQYASPTLSEDVEAMLENVKHQAAWGGPLGALGLLLAAVVLFVQFDRAFDRIWRVEQESQGFVDAIKTMLRTRLRAFLMLLGVAALVLVVFVAGMSLNALQRYGDKLLPVPDVVWMALQFGATVALNTLVFGLLFRYLPKGEVAWRDALQGGLLTAVAWEIGRMVLAAFIINDRYDAYGIVGSFIGVMLWFYYASLVVFLGAEYTQVVQHSRLTASRSTNFRRD